MKFIRLGAMMIPTSVIEMIPEHVARENTLLAIDAESGKLTIAVADPNIAETIEKLAFILNKDIEPVLADRFDLLAAIDRNYRQSENEAMM